MKASEFFKQMSAQSAIKSLRDLETNHFLKNTFLAELREYAQHCEDQDYNIKESVEHLLKFINCQIDGLVTHSVDISNTSYNLSQVCDLLENLKTEKTN